MRPSSSASTGRRRAPSKAGRRPSSSRTPKAQGDPQGDPDDRAGGGRPKQSFPKTTTKAPPPVTQEVEGVGNPDEEEEDDDGLLEDGLDDEDLEDEVGREDGVAARDEEELDDEDPEDEVGLEDGFAARDEVANRNDRVIATARRSTDDVTVRARAALALAWEPRGRLPPNFVRPDQPYDVAARALAALRDNEPYRNPRLLLRKDSRDASTADDGTLPPG
jgi:hypothetical protein